LPAFKRQINAAVFTQLNVGDGTTLGVGYDGLSFFHASHIDDGAKYVTGQDNVSALTLSIDNFETVSVAAQGVRDDQGNYVNLNHNLIVTSPSLERIAAQITGNAWTYDTANREVNPYSGRTSYITAPQMDATAWVLVAANENTKPIFVAVRKRPQLLDIFYDSGAGEGGIYYIRYHGRYVIVYGDWRLAHMGNT
jgi:phage major head subunit gpT-like protein